METQSGNPSLAHRSTFWARRSTNLALWTIQVLLALLFLFAGSMKLVMPIAAMTKEIRLPGLFLRFIGVAEVLGGIGLVLPWWLRIRRELTPLAASGLTVIMAGAIAVGFATGGLVPALFPLAVGLLLLFVAQGRRIGLIQNARPLPQPTLQRKAG